jgi:hypothetical protein
MQAAPTVWFIPFVVEPCNDHFAVKAQKLLIDLSYAITRMDRRFEEGSEPFKLAAGEEKHFWMRKLSVALQKGNPMTFCAYLDWRNGRNRQVRGQVGYTAKTGTRKRRFCDVISKPCVPRFDYWTSIRA